MGINLTSWRLAPSELVVESSARVSYSSGAETPFFSFLSEAGPSVARLASRRETLLSKLRGADTGRDWEKGSVAAAACSTRGEGNLLGVAEWLVRLCSSGTVFPLSSPRR